MIFRSITRNSLVLGLFALVTAGLLAYTFDKTKSRIQAAERRAAEKALLEIIPRETHDNDLLADTLAIPEAHLSLLGLSESDDIHIARRNGKVVALIIPATAPDGYSGAIKLIVGIRHDGSVAGVRVLSHRETPGLGDKIDLSKDDWILDFNGTSLIKPAVEHWTVKKDGGHFDQFTGATITPRAVIHRIRDTLTYFETFQTTLLEQDQAQHD